MKRRAARNHGVCRLGELLRQRDVCVAVFVLNLCCWCVPNAHCVSLLLQADRDHPGSLGAKLEDLGKMYLKEIEDIHRAGGVAGGAKAPGRRQGGGRQGAKR